MAAVTTLPGLSSVPGDAVLEVSDQLWHAFNLPSVYGNKVMITVQDAEQAPVAFAVAWPSSGAVDGGNVAGTTNKRLVGTNVAGASYDLVGIEDRTPRAAYVCIGLLSDPGGNVTVTVTVD